MENIWTLSKLLADGTTTSEALTRAALERIADPAGQGAATFTQVHAESALATARAMDALRRHGVAPSPLAGVPISIKDLFDEAGQETLAGSVACKGEGAAAEDAPVVRALRRAGAVLVGRTNMTEFAYSGLGLNPHYGTPLNPWDRDTGRIPGGSSSGAAVSVTDGMAAAAIGTDTGGSVRIPAALCGLTGFKPTARRVSRAGVFPLSESLDSVGPLAPTVRCCALLDAVLTGQEPGALAERPVRGTRFAVPRTLLFDGVDATVAAAFDRAVTALSEAGAVIEDLSLPELSELSGLAAHGGLVAAEALATHRARMAEKGHLYDPRVIARIRKAEGQGAADYVAAVRARADLIRRVIARTVGYDALLAPTIPVVAPPIADLADDDAYNRTNMLMLRNPSAFNMLDHCAVTLPCHEPGTAPVGLMVIGAPMTDAALLQVAAGVEQVLTAARGRAA